MQSCSCESVSHMDALAQYTLSNIWINGTNNNTLKILPNSRTLDGYPLCQNWSATLYNTLKSSSPCRTAQAVEELSAICHLHHSFIHTPCLPVCPMMATKYESPRLKKLACLEGWGCPAPLYLAEAVCAHFVWPLLPSTIIYYYRRNKYGVISSSFAHENAVE